MRPITIGLINQKGGCGKSSLCFHLSAAFARAGRRVLLVDADPQGSLSQGFFGPNTVESLDSQETLASLFGDGNFSPPEGICAATAIENVSIVRSNERLAAYNVPCPETTGLRQFELQTWLDRQRNYDLALVDCPPNLYQCSWNALLAADFVLVPVPPEDFGTQGLRPVHQAIQYARILNSRLTLLGHVVTRYDGRLLLHRTYTAKLRRMYGDGVLQTVIAEASAFKVSLACRRPVGLFAPHSKAARLTDELAQEIIDRIRLGSHERRHA